jgi:hypothetical protein
MLESENLNPAERELVEAMQGLQPAPLQTSSREMWYQAGLAAGRRRANGWRAVAAAVTLAATLLVVSSHRTPSPVERYVYVRTPAASVPVVPAAIDTTSTPTASAGPVASSSSTAEYLRLCDEAAQDGPMRLPYDSTATYPASYSPHGPGSERQRGQILPVEQNILNEGDGR